MSVGIKASWHLGRKSGDGVLEKRVEVASEARQFLTFYQYHIHLGCGAVYSKRIRVPKGLTCSLDKRHVKDLGMKRGNVNVWHGN